VDVIASGSRSSASAGRRIPELDGWRGLSIIFVVLGHLVGVRYPELVASAYLAPLGVAATWGVRIFFVIRGFIITRLAMHEYEITGKFSASRFYIRRLFRIVPAFFCYLLCIALGGSSGLIVPDQAGVLRAAIFVCNVPQVACGHFVEHSWTLAYEEQFYLLFPLLLMAGARRMHAAAGGVFVALMVFPLLRYGLGLGGAWHSAYQMIPGFSFICAGVLLAIYHDRIAQAIASRSAAYGYGSVVLLTLMAINTTLALPLASPAAYWQALINQLCWPICIAWLVAVSLRRNSIGSRFLNLQVLQFFGMISYSLYLWQQAFTASPSLYLTDSWLVISPLMLIVAWLSYQCIERPAIRLGRLLLGSDSARLEPLAGLPGRTVETRQAPTAG
jgi:peptidoglycan/LPS O-acetylase OafA/YrhL